MLGRGIDQVLPYPCRRVLQRIVNLETSFTRSEDYERKGIKLPDEPENAACLSAPNYLKF